MGRRGYGQFCPVAKAAEVLCERWTLLVLRELLEGSRRFSELRRGLPQISPTMLSQRLRELEDSGLVLKRRVGGAPGAAAWEYHLSEAGRELGPIVDHLGAWGQRWAVAALRHVDFEPAYLMWAAYRTLRPDIFGPRRVVIAFELTDAPVSKRRWWLIVDDGEVDLCLKNPGFPVDLTVHGRTKTFALVCLGHVTPEEAVRSGSITFDGAPELARTFAAWCPRSTVADLARPA
jgi:DNA-binding HxlR family transcriptional regulator